MSETTPLVQAIITGIQEKKGRSICIADLSAIETAPCRYNIICTASSPQQAEAVSDSVRDTTRIACGEEPAATAGLPLAHWVAMDYGTAMVHILLPEERDYYNLEALWPSAPLTNIPDLD